MRYLLDTGIAQEFIGRNAKVVQRMDGARRAGNRIGICTPVLGELWSGVEGSISRDRNLHRLRLALSRLVIWPYTNEAAEQFGRVFANFAASGGPCSRSTSWSRPLRSPSAIAQSYPRTRIWLRFLG